MFGRPKENKKGKCYAFSGYKQRKKASLVSIECNWNNIGMVDAFSG